MSMLRADTKKIRILATLLAMPAADALEALQELLPEAPWLEPVLSELRQSGLEQWQAEYTRLFVSGYPKTPCPPYASAYRQGTMGGTIASDLAQIYLRAGLQATEAPADYLGTMLECAAYLEEQGMDELLSELVDAHMRKWVPRFAADLQGHARLALYRELGRQIAGLFPEDADRE